MDSADMDIDMDIDLGPIDLPEPSDLTVRSRYVQSPSPPLTC